jgi:hypothetical protein
VAAWLAYKKFALVLIAVFMPYILRGFFMWAWNFIAKHNQEMTIWFSGKAYDWLATAGIIVDLQLSGVGGYIANKVGLIEYCTVIITGWSLVWVIGIGMRTTALVRR